MELNDEPRRHWERNAELRKSLIAQHVTLTEERPIEVFFRAQTQRDAAILARELYRRGFLVTLLAPASTSDAAGGWTVAARVIAPPEEVLGEKFTERMLQLAAEHDAVYDGWGASV